MTVTGSASDAAGIPPTWEERVTALWSDAETSPPEDTFARMHQLVGERPADDPVAMFELASAYDYLGQEAEAIPRYRSALAGELDDDRRHQAAIQLASSLRNVGDAAGAVEVLSAATVTGGASAAFLAMALHDLGRHDEALKVALYALADTDPTYGRAIIGYAADL